MSRSIYMFKRVLFFPALTCCGLLLLLQIISAVTVAPLPNSLAPFKNAVVQFSDHIRHLVAQPSIAKETTEQKEGTEESSQKKEKPLEYSNPPQKNPPVRITPNSPDPAEKALLENLAKRRKALEEWGASIKLKEQILNAGERKINKKLEQLNILKKEVKSILSEYEKREEDKHNRLVKIYENMKPKDAARIFDVMDYDTLIAVLEKMKEAKAAPILAGMQTERVSFITQQLLERRKINTKKLPDPNLSPSAGK